VSAGLRVLSAEDFEHAEHRAIFQVVRHYDITEPADWEQRVEPTLQAPLERLLTTDLPGKEGKDQDEDFVREELLGLVLALRDRQLRLQGQQLLFTIAEAAERGDSEWYAQCKTLQREHSQTVNRLRQLRVKRTRYALSKTS
jgi:hypothetical protein